jgi:hypothetical protein
MKRTVFFLLVLACISFETFSQQTIEANVQDKVVLTADEFHGTIQWLSSSDQLSWSEISGATVSPFEITVSSLPSYFQAKIEEPNCQPHFSEIITVQKLVPVTYKLWSDPATWNGVKPKAGDAVQIPAGQDILLDENPPALASLTINGTLEFKRQDVSLTAKLILVHGKLVIGTASQPFTHKAVITLNGDNVNESVMGMGTRGIMVMGGHLELHGATPQKTFTRINADAAKNSTNLTLADITEWNVGDEIVIGPTDFYAAAEGQSVSQKVSLVAMAGNTATISQGLNAFRYGQLQYPTANGMSNTATNVLAAPVADTDAKKTPLVLDERAPIGNLTRKIVIQSPDDAVWKEQGFGVHVMISAGGVAHVDGVEIRRAGQRGRLGRYGIHCHMLSYNGTNTLPDVQGQYIKNSTISHSTNRGIVIHGTNGLLVKNNILFDIQGHGIFTEDAVERRNTIDGNLVLKVRNPAVSPASALKQHEIGERGSAGFWISNPDNIVINNIAADCRSNGFWLAFTTQAWGESNGQILMNPSRLAFGKFDNNTAHSNRLEGIMLDNVEADNQGNTIGFQYSSTSDMKEPTWNSGTRKRFTLSNYKVWKNGSNGIWDRAVWPDNHGVVSADNCGRFFAGSGSDGIIERSLVVGTSLNHLKNNTDRPTFNDTQGGDQTPAAFATYHSTFDIKDNIIVNFPLVANTRSGAFATEDYYTRAVEKGQKRNINNNFIQTHPGVKLKAVFNYFTLASALWDPHGTWGPVNNYFVYDDPFLTHGLTVTPVAPGSAAGGVSAPGPFYGFNAFVLHGVGDVPPKNQPWNDLMAIKVRRLDNALQPIATWDVPAAQPDYLLAHMRSFAAHATGIYELTFPGQVNQPTDFQMDVENMLDATDQTVIAVQFSGNLNANVVMRSYTNRFDVYQSLGSVTDVINSSGGKFWQDKPNNIVWVKLRGGFWQFWTTNTSEAVPTDDEKLYEPTVLRIYQQ